MIARMWHGMVPVSKADEYLDLMRRIALPEYLDTGGNRGAWCLYRTEAGVRHFEMLTFWDDTDAVKRFAGDDFRMAKYYDFDSDYLIEMEPHVRHYEVYSDSSPELYRPTDGHNVGGENTIARVWGGIVSIEKSEAYFRYLTDFGCAGEKARGCNFCCCRFGSRVKLSRRTRVPTLPKPTITPTTLSASSSRRLTSNTMKSIKCLN
jgi:heme-degrading monooxygenase HmoA